jgi:hypothetical protein
VTSDKIERSDTPTIDGWQKADGGYTFEKTFDLIRVDDVFLIIYERISVKPYVRKDSIFIL